MESLKKILKWVGISLAIILGIILILIVCMYFFPNFSLFGYRFVRQNSVPEQAEVVYVEQCDHYVDNYYVIITTHNFDIDISENNTLDQIQVSYVDKKWGFADVQESKLFVTSLDNTITIRTLETNGLVTGTGKLTITMPKYFLANININTNADVHIDKGYLSSLTISMTNGDLKWEAHEYMITEEVDGEKVTRPAIEPEMDQAEWLEKTQVSINSLSIFCEGADIDLQCFKDITIENGLYIRAKKLSLDLEYLIATAYINCNELNMNIEHLGNVGDLQIITTSGNINIDTLNADKTNILTERMKIYIRACVSDIDIVTKTNDILLANTFGITNISTTSGNVEITSAQENIAIETNSGNISIMEYNASADITTINGNITMHNKGEENPNYVTNIKQDSGRINVTTETNSIKITSSKGSNIRMIVRSMPANKNIRHNIFNTFGTTNLSILIENTPFKIRAVGEVSGELAHNVIIASNLEYVIIDPPGYTGVAEEYASLNVEGGAVIFEAIYE